MSKLTIGLCLPCVVKLALHQYLEEKAADLLSTYEFQIKAARDDDDFTQSDLIISTGYRRLARYSEVLKSDYVDPLAGWPANQDFKAFRPLDRRFGLMGSVSLVFIIDHKRLANRQTPLAYSDFFKPEFSDSLVYTSDESLLEDLVLPILSEDYSAKQIEAFRKSLLAGMHPSQMTQRGDYQGQACAYLMPYFFAGMKENEPGIELVWPREGAFSLPVFISCRQESLAGLEPFFRALQDPELIEILSASGRFPSRLAEGGNNLLGEIRFRQDYIERLV